MNESNYEKLAIRHYSKLKPLGGIVLSGDTESFFTLKSVDTVDFFDSMLKGDPIIIGYLKNDNVRLNGGSIISMDKNKNSITISPDKTVVMAERRECERFPLSLLGDAKTSESNKKRSQVCIKDMSYSGLRIYSTADFEVEDNIEIDIYLHNSVLAINATIKRKSLCYGRNEYGLQIVYRDKSSIYSVKDFLDKLLSSEKELLKKELFKVETICKKQVI